MSDMPDLCKALFDGKLDLVFGSIFSLHAFINSPMGRGFQSIDQTMPTVNGVCIAVRKEEPLLHPSLGSRSYLPREKCQDNKHYRERKWNGSSQPLR